MIFITSQTDQPLFRGRVNGISEKELSNGGKITTIILGTTEKKQDGTPIYSSWFCNLMGQARKDFESDPLEKGDYINVFSFKQTNVSKKKDDGGFEKAFFNLTLNNYEKFSYDNNGGGNPNGYAKIDDEDSPY